MVIPLSSLGRLALVAACALSLAGCDALAEFMGDEAYRGPPPAEESISSEVAVVRLVEVVPPGYPVLLIDRVRYVEAGDPHNVNRVVRAASGDSIREEVAALMLHRGDSVVISTRYGGAVTVVGSMNVPDWPGHRAYEYPIGLHGITAIRRVGD